MLPRSAGVVWLATKTWRQNRSGVPAIGGSPQGFLPAGPPSGSMALMVVVEVVVVEVVVVEVVVVEVVVVEVVVVEVVVVEVVVLEVVELATALNRFCWTLN